MEAIFPTWAYGVVCLASALISALSAPFWIRSAQRLGLIDHPGARKIHARPMPLVGGLIVATGLLIPMLGALALVKLALLDAPLLELSSYGLNQRTLQLAGLFAGALAMLGLGIVDDRSALSARPKLVAQFLIALLVTSTGTRVTLFIPNPLVSYLITILWFLTLINAFNFTDNMNGLCTGLAAISALTFAVHAALPSHYLVATIGFLVAGALLGYLPFNYPNAKTFLGDSGSHLVGYLIAAIAVLPHFHHPEQPNKWGVISPLLILGLVWIDFAWVILYRLWHRCPIYIGDTNHLSHQLVRRGFSPPAAVAALWLTHATLCLSSFLLTRSP